MLCLGLWGEALRTAGAARLPCRQEGAGTSPEEARVRSRWPEPYSVWVLFLMPETGYHAPSEPSIYHLSCPEEASSLFLPGLSTEHHHGPCKPDPGSSSRCFLLISKRLQSRPGPSSPCRVWPIRFFPHSLQQPPGPVSVGAVLHPGSAPPPYRPEQHFPAAPKVRLPLGVLPHGAQPRRLDSAVRGSRRTGALGMFAE